MKNQQKIRSALKAWAASLPLALGIPVSFWTIGWAVDGEIIKHVEYWLLTLAISTGVHLVSYLVTGLPIFLCAFENADSLIWKLPFGLTSGVILGACVPLMIWLFSDGRPDSDLPWQFVLCGAYGAVTTIAAYRQRPIPKLS